MEKTLTDRPLDKPASTRLIIPTEWTAFRSSTLPSTGATWSEYDTPAELSLLPDTLKIPPKLAEIIRWSLRRPALRNAVLSSDSISTKDEQPDSALEPSPPPLSDDRAETSSTISDTRSKSSSFGRAVPTLRGLKRDLVGTAVSKITTLKEKHDRDRATSKTLTKASPAVEKAKTGECTSCFDDLPLDSLVKLPCRHNYCKPCLSTLILTALQNESAFPPKCCLSEIPAKTIVVALDKKQQQLYKEKAAEYSIPANRRWYCPNVKCLKWIPPNKLHHSRMNAQKCPHCQSKICGMCRGAAHDRQVDCPQDFGLEATINIAESEGWRRCHSCRTMVERSTGCRHITCKCGAEFCYVCASPWRTCSCTEVDEANRQALLRRQREDRDAADQAEADEVARAIAVVEALLRSEADARRQQDEEEEHERQREEAELARLEQIRLAEEAVREREREEAERQLRDTLRLSIREDAEKLMASLKELLHAQHVALDDRQGANEQLLISTLERDSEILTKNAEMLLANMQKNVNRRIDQLKVKQLQEAHEMGQKQEEQEDDLFLQIQTHLKGKPNREQREKRLLEGMRREQEEETAQVKRKHEDELKALEGVAVMEIEGLKRSGDLRRKKAKKDFDRGIAQLLKMMAIDRMWFNVVWERRIEMMEEHGRMMTCEFEGGREPLGLTEEQAMTIMPLPVRIERAMDIVKDEQHQIDSIQHTPVELEAPMIIPRKPVPSPPAETELPAATALPRDTVTRLRYLRERDADSLTVEVGDSRTASSSSFVTAPSHACEGNEYSELSRNPWAWALDPPERSDIADAGKARLLDDRKKTVVTRMLDDVRAATTADYFLPASTRLARHLTPPSPITDNAPSNHEAPGATLMPMPHNGNAYSFLKNGECSHPIYDIGQIAPDLITGLDRPTAPPTPPESPFMPGSFPSHALPTDRASPWNDRPLQAAKSEISLRVPSRLSSGGSSINTTMTVTPTEQISSNSSPMEGSLRRTSKVKPKRLSVPPMTCDMYMDPALDTSRLKNKSPADGPAVRREPIRFPDNMLSPTAPKENQKRSFWPFRSKTYTDEEIKERMKRAVGDAMAA